MNLPYIIGGSGNITVMVNYVPKTIATDHFNYAKIKQALIKGDEKEVIDLINGLEDEFTRMGLKGEIVLKDGIVFCGGKPYPNAISKEVLRFYNEGFPLDPMVNLIKNMVLNPRPTALDQLYRFIEANNITITPDGCILLYKRVGAEYMDLHTNTIRNAVGDKPSMPYDSVDYDPNVTCSFGLHVCSMAYLSSMGGQHTMICKVNPKDIVSVPTDYNNTKMRCCAYEVVAEIPSESVEGFDGKPVRNSDATEYRSANPCGPSDVAPEDEEEFDVEEDAIDDDAEDLYKDSNDPFSSLASKIKSYLTEGHASVKKIQSTLKTKGITCGAIDSWLRNQKWAELRKEGTSVSNNIWTTRE